MKTINIKAIRIDGGTQSRVEINNEVVADYAAAIKVGIEFPPVIVFHDGADYWLADGFHRYHAHNQAGKASIAADVHNGTARDAILFSAGANGAHGLRRTNADKRKAVELLLADPEWAAWSDRQIAKVCAVTHPFVSGIRTPKVVTVTTPAPEKEATKPTKKGGGAKSDSTKTKPAKPTKPSKPPKDGGAPEYSELDEAKDVATGLAHENQVLTDRLAVEAMDASEEEKLMASATIAELRAELDTAQAMLVAITRGRDQLMRENGELKKQCMAQQREIKKLRAT